MLCVNVKCNPSFYSVCLRLLVGMSGIPWWSWTNKWWCKQVTVGYTKRVMVVWCYSIHLHSWSCPTYQIEPNLWPTCLSTVMMNFDLIVLRDHQCEESRKLKIGVNGYIITSNGNDNFCTYILIQWVQRLISWNENHWLYIHTHSYCTHLTC